MPKVELVELSPILGVEVRGIDLRQELDEATVNILQQAFRKSMMVLFRGQDLSEQDQAKAVGIFGPVLDEFQDGPIHSMVSNVDPGAYLGKIADAELIFHSDYTNTDSPPSGLSLYAMAVSSDAPGTKFINAQYAYERLSPEFRAKLDSLTVIDGTHEDGYASATSDSKELLSRHASRHPAVIDHPRNGRRQIYCNSMWTNYIDGMNASETRDLLDKIFNHLYSDKNMYEHKWAQGDFVVWDNIGLQHGRNEIPPNAVRRFRRVAMGKNGPGQVDLARRMRDYSASVAL